MRTHWLGLVAALAALAIPAAPAAAGDRDGTHFSSGPSAGASFIFGERDGDRDRRDRRQRSDGDIFIGEWPQQGDTAWRSDSFNDWWHDQPHRSQPAWVRRNRDCQRQYWVGGGWTC